MKRLRQVHIFPLLLLAAGIFGLYSCTQEGFPGEDAGAIGNSGNSGSSTPPFSISVSDGGYAPAEPSTRAAESNFQTSFTAGDQIGVYAVKNNAIVSGVNNLCLTAVSNGSSGIKWTIPEGTMLPLDATYYAYYPWQASLKGNPTPGAATASAATFFANAISQWTPATDQRTYAKYTAQDLMIAKGVVNTTTTSLSFSMTHQMALAVLDLPTKYNYTLTSDKDYKWTASVTSGNGYPVGDVYHYIVKPGSTVSGTCVSSNDEAWSTTTTISAGYYKTITIDGGKSGTTLEKLYTIHAGDYLLPGWTLKNKDATLTDADKANCIGIVFWAGNVADKDKTLKAAHPKCTHGLAVDLKDLSDTPWQAVASVQEWLDANAPGYLSINGSSQVAINNTQGYNNTEAIKKYNEAGVKLVQPVVEVTQYQKEAASQAIAAYTSGWYLPSLKELSILCGYDADDIHLADILGTKNRDLINEKLAKIGDRATLFQVKKYWASTEDSNGVAFNMNFSTGQVANDSKVNFVLAVRCVLAF